VATGIRLDQRSVRPKALASHETLGDASRLHCFKEMSEQIAFSKPTVRVIREGRVVGHSVGQVQPTKPAICQVEMNLLVKPPFRPYAEGVANDQHPHHQLGIDPCSTRRAVEWREKAPHVSEINEPVHGSQQAIRWHMILERELIEQRALRHLPRSHHRSSSHLLSKLKQPRELRSRERFSKEYALPTCSIPGLTISPLISRMRSPAGRDGVSA